GRRKRNIVEFARAGFGCQIHLESRSGQHLIRMQSLYEEHACLVAAGIDGAVIARNCNEGLSGKCFWHRFSTDGIGTDQLFKDSCYLNIAWRLRACGDSADKAQAPCRDACSAGCAPVNVEQNDGAPDDFPGTKQLEVFVDILESNSFDGMLNL